MSLQKFKVKEQFTQIKAQFKQQKDQLPLQSQMLFTMMVQFVELLIMVMEEKFTKRMPRNSSRPYLPTANRVQSADMAHLLEGLKKIFRSTGNPEIQANVIKKLINKIEVGEESVRIHYVVSVAHLNTDFSELSTTCRGSNSLTNGAQGET